MFLGKWLVLLAGIINGASAQPDTIACTQVVVKTIDDIVAIANDYVQAAVDCTLPGLDELSCASDITNSIKTLSEVAQFIAQLTLYCGHLDNMCANDIAGIVEKMAELAANLIAAAGDCLSDTFICTFDVATAIDVLNGGIENLLAAIDQCNPGTINPHLHDQFGAFGYPGTIWQVWDRATGNFGMDSRRLTALNTTMPAKSADSEAPISLKDLQGVLTQNTQELLELNAAFRAKQDGTIKEEIAKKFRETSASLKYLKNLALAAKQAKEEKDVLV